jgi:cytochrome c-type biogenesis protein
MLDANLVLLSVVRHVLGSGVAPQPTTESVNFIATFGEGVLSFLAPCVLPLVPGYLSFVSGVSLAKLAKTQPQPLLQTNEAVATTQATMLVERQKVQVPTLTRSDTRRVFLSTLLFVAGFTLVFILFFGFLNLLIEAVGDIRTPLRIGSGILVIAFGLNFLGIFKVGFLNMERRIQPNQVKSASYIGAFLLGGAFSFGWSPCVGPFLTTAVFTAQQGSAWEGLLLMLTYSAGLGVPFILAGLFFSQFLGFVSAIRKHFYLIEIVSGLLLIVVGTLLMTDNLAQISEQLSQIKFF